VNGVGRIAILGEHPRITWQMKAAAAAKLDASDHAILGMRLAGDSLAEIADTLRLPVTAIADRTRPILATLDSTRTRRPRQLPRAETAA
jgi:hypothetical protein